MPAYDYECADCGHVFEELVLKRGRDEPDQCPECHAKADKLRQLPGAPSARVKPGLAGGGGWDRQGDTWIKSHRGGHSTRYGDGIG